MYVYSNLNGVDSDGEEIWEWSKCSVEEIDNISYYTLNLENIEAKQYEYSAALIYNYEEIPDISEVDSDWWTAHRVDYNDNPGINSTFTPDEEPIKYINQDATAEDLSSILPESGYVISGKDETFTLSLDLTYDGDSVTCPDYGSLYIIGSWHVDAADSWDEWDKLEYNASTGLYETTLDSADVIYARTYEYDICFVYDNQTFDKWTNKLTLPIDYGDDYNRHMTFSWKESETLSHEDSCTLDIDPSSLGNLSRGTETEPMTVYFNIVSYDTGNVYQTDWGYNLYVCGSWDEWDSFYQCDYDDDELVSYNVVYRVNLPVTSIGSYEFKIVNCYGENAGNWDGTPIVTGSIGVDGNAQITFDATDIANGYKVVTFYTDYPAYNVQ